MDGAIPSRRCWSELPPPRVVPDPRLPPRQSSPVAEAPVCRAERDRSVGLRAAQTGARGGRYTTRAHRQAPGEGSRRKDAGLNLGLLQDQGQAGLTVTARSRDQQAGRGRNSCFLPTPPQPDDRESAGCQRLGQWPDADPVPHGLGKATEGGKWLSARPATLDPPAQARRRKQGLWARAGGSSPDGGAEGQSTPPRQAPAPSPAPPPRPFPARDPRVPRPSACPPVGATRRLRA